MKITEQEIAAFKMLFDKAQDLMSNRICTDIDPDILAMFTSEELSEMAREYHEWNGDPEEWSEGDYLCLTQDWIMFGVLFRKIKEVLKPCEK